MGFMSGLGSIAKGIGKVGLGSAHVAGDIGMDISKGVGKSLINQFNTRGAAVVGTVLAGATAGAILADQDGQVDPRKAAFKGGAWGAGLAAFGGSTLGSTLGIGAGLGSTLGLGAAGAAMIGVNALGTVGRGMIKTPKGPVGLGDLGEFKLNKATAIPLILGASAFKGIADGVSAFEKSRMGTNDGMMRNATPIVPVQQQSSGGSYSNNAGATGDLVFSMFANR
jgi:hypothetical protein